MAITETADRAALLEDLRATREALRAAIAGLTDLQGKFKPAPDAWSIEDCVEHLALVENGLLLRLTQEATPSEHIERLERQAAVRKMGVDRSSKRQAPERARPNGRFGSLQKALDQFVANREKTIAYLRDCPDDLHARTITHPILATMTAHEFVIFMTGHTLRHVDQIREIQQMPGFPA